MKNWLLVLVLVLALACSSDNKPETEAYEPTPLALNIPEIFEQNIISPVIPNNNPQTVEGVALGKKLGKTV